ncbi:MAG: reverse transcriptase domain-containing protein [Candidatus Bathyarchaeia archaeon]|jgi:retron-type reverse transcriptase
MSASSDFRKCFSKKHLIDIYNPSLRYRAAVGIDRINTRLFETNLNEHIRIIRRKAFNGTYRFSQYREKLLLRGQKKLPRPISIPTIRDKLTQKALFEVLYSVYGSSMPFLHQIIADVIATLSGGQYDAVLRFDAKDFYPSINHDLLMKKIQKKMRKKEILHLIKDAISQRTVPEPESHPKTFTTVGVPQGLSISNLLADIYMSALDSKHNRKGFYRYFRYVDDILIICKSADCDRIQKEIEEDCGNLQLNLHGKDDDPSKICSGSISNGFSYLGYEFTPSRITVRRKSLDYLRESLIKLFTTYKYSRTHDLNLLKWGLDLRITGCIFDYRKYGWLFFFSQIDDLPLLNSLDHFVKKQCFRFGVDPSQLKVKRFVRAYHEIRKNISNTSYIPNFDKMPIKSKRRLLTDIFNVQTKLMSADEIQYQFNKRIYRTVRDLERDLARAS